MTTEVSLPPPPERPAALVTDGRAHLGVFSTAFEHTNLGDLGWPSRLVPRRLRALRLKEWQACQFGNERYFFIAALFNAKTLAIAQLKGFDFETGRVFRVEKRLPPWRLSLADSLVDSANRFSSPELTLEFRNRLGEGAFDLRVDAATRGTRVTARLHADVGAATPEVVCLPLENGAAMYSHKTLLPAAGTLEIDGQETALTPKTGFLIVDDHKGFYPYIMHWSWVTGAGRDASGRLIGFNLTRNQARDPDRNNENCLWVAGKKSHFGAVMFVTEKTARGERWRVRDKHGRVDLCFDIASDERLRLNALVIASRYRGPYGRFSGTLVDDSGERIALDGMRGMGEQFYVRG